MKNIFRLFFILSVLSLTNVMAQTSSPTPTPTPTPRPKRTSRVSLDETKPTPSPTPVQIADNSKNEREKETVQPTPKETPDSTETPKNDDEKARLERERLERERLEREKQQKADDIKAGLLLLDRERDKVRQETEQKMSEESKKRELELQQQIAAEKQKREDELRLQEQEKQRLEKEKLDKEREAEELRVKLQQQEKERLEAKEKAEAEEKQRRELEEKTRLEQQRLQAELEEKNRQTQLEADEKIRLAQKESDEKTAKERLEKEKIRVSLIQQTAVKLKFLNLADAQKMIPADMTDSVEIEKILAEAVKKNPRLVKAVSFCDGDFIGEEVAFSVPSEAPFSDLLDYLRFKFNLNFLPDAEIVNLPIRVNVADMPWNVLLRAQLNANGLDAVCMGNGIIISKRDKMQALQEAQRKNAPLKTELIKLRYIQPTSGGTVDVAGRTSGGSNTFASLEATINKILRSGGDTRGAIAQIPGKAEFFITATEEQITQIKAVIERADKPSYQVIVYALVYTANENKLRDIGGQVSLIGATPNLNILGGLANIGGGSSNNGGGGTTTGGGTTSDTPTQTTVPGQPVPGGIRSFGQGFGTPTQGNTIGGFSAILGNVQFSAQLSLLQQKGVVKIENRPMIFVEDGQTGLLKIGRQVAVPIVQNNVGGSSNSQLEILNAANTLQVTPQVITDLDGNPIGVKLSTQIESNEVDTSVVSQGIPSILQRSAQSNFQINLGETVVLGDFTTDAETDSQTKTPGLGDLPVVGNLFKRKVKSVQKDRLFFAIRVEVVPVGTTVNTVPIQLDTTPKIPTNEFFAPNNKEQVPVTTTVKPNPTPIQTPSNDKP